MSSWLRRRVSCNCPRFLLAFLKRVVTAAKPGGSASRSARKPRSSQTLSASTIAASGRGVRRLAGPSLATRRATESMATRLRWMVLIATRCPSKSPIQLLRSRPSIPRLGYATRLDAGRRQARREIAATESDRQLSVPVAAPPKVIKRRLSTKTASPIAGAPTGPLLLIECETRPV